jgi:hypothetical protein
VEQLITLEVVKQVEQDRVIMLMVVVVVVLVQVEMVDHPLLLDLVELVTPILLHFHPILLTEGVGVVVVVHPVEPMEEEQEEVVVRNQLPELQILVVGVVVLDLFQLPIIVGPLVVPEYVYLHG